MKRNVLMSTAAALTVLFVVCSYGIAAAKELVYPVQCYQGAELQKVQDWEKQWVGKKISSANVDEVKDFLPERGPEGEILNWESGVPFPDTTDATEMAHNFRTRCYGDGYRNQDNANIVDGRLKYDMSVEIKNNLCFFSGRTDTPPLPEFPHNPKQIWRAFTMLQLAPPETRNMRIMEIHYKDTLKPYDSWFWMPSIRRIRRRSTTERQDAQGGADSPHGYKNSAAHAGRLRF